MKLPETYPKNKRHIHAVIETPCGSRNKFEYDPESGLFKLSKVIPAGMEFPCDMGFIPGTRGEDGDPLDVLILMDELTYPGCVIECRLLGVIKASQKEPHKKAERNDRFIAVPVEMTEHSHLKHIEDLNGSKLESIVEFFENYNKREHKKFKLLKLIGPKKAQRLVRKFKL